MASKLTPSMLRILVNVRAGRDATFGFAGGRSTAGGLTGTFSALRRHGLLIWDRGSYHLTPLGLSAIQSKEAGEP